MIGALYDAGKLGILKLLVLLDAIKRVLWPMESGIIQQGRGTQVPGSRSTLCIFAHFDRDSIVDDYVIFYLRALDELGCETVFVSTAEELGTAEIGKVIPFCRQFIVKRNVGYDFASWRTGFEAVGELSAFDRLIIANDSVYGPLQDLREVFAEMDDRQPDFWGITDSLRYGRHLQSYFIVFGRPVLQSSVFKEFWQQLPDYRSKHVVVIRGEVGLTRRLAAAGFRFAAHNPIKQVCTNMPALRGGMRGILLGRRFNPTHIGWQALLRAACPFLKIQLLRDNPKRLAGLDRWDEIVKDVSDYDTGLILHHLERVGTAMRSGTQSTFIRSRGI